MTFEPAVRNLLDSNPNLESLALERDGLLFDAFQARVKANRLADYEVESAPEERVVADDDAVFAYERYLKAQETYKWAVFMLTGGASI